MTFSTFKSMAIDSAKVYYQFLGLNGKGISAIEVSEIKPVSDDFFLLRLKTRLPANAAGDLEGLFFRFNGRDYTSHEVAPVEYSSIHVTLRVRPIPRLRDAFYALRPNELQVCSDLKFLVKRVENWYVDRGDRLSLPSSPPEPVEIITVSQPSEQQFSAILDALFSSLSYIWGAPGTGKTRVVLASCLVSLLKAKRKVLLLAPTNNSLEQVLTGLMPALDKARISRRNVIRLGGPSTQFADQYPEICEVAGIARQIDALTAESVLIDGCLGYRRSRDRFDSASGRLHALLPKYQDALDDYREVCDQLDALSLSVVEYRAKDVLLRREAVHLLSELNAAQRARSTPISSIKKALFPRAHARLLADEEHKAALLRENARQLDSLAGILADSALKATDLEGERDRLSASLSGLKSEMLDASGFWAGLRDAVGRLSEGERGLSVSEVAALLESGAQMLDAKARHYTMYDTDDDARLVELQKQLAEQIRHLRESTVEERMRKASVVACTMDKFLTLSLSRDPDSFYPDHVFLDEAGYCSTIKGMTLLSLNVPVTFLGDHMQLPPVCEMSDSLLALEGNQSVCLWAQSAIHLDSVLQCTPQGFLDVYESGSSPSFRVLQKFDLDRTYRFGDALAEILAGHIYSDRFHSASSASTELVVLDAPRGRGDPRLVSTAEAEAIRLYLEDSGADDYAILTPYRKQVAALTRRLPGAARDGRVMTVHASQGREWDTVFFSVAVTSDHAFIGDANFKGRRIVNTALSRAKKRLVIVCDRGYWRKQTNHLIGKIISKCDPPD